MKRSVLANFEGGRRPALSVAELIVLARILEVPPVQLLFPIGRQTESRALPGDPVDTWEALKWFTGEQALVPQPSDSNLTLLQDAAEVFLFRQHDADVSAVNDARRMILAFASETGEGIQDRPTDAANPALMSQLTSTLSRAEQQLLELRRKMRELGLTPPRLYDLDYLVKREELK
jgi:hypothetical protein